MKDIFLRFAFSARLDWVAFIFFVALVVYAAYLYYRTTSLPERRRTIFLRLIVAVVGFRITFAAFKSGLQYYAWAGDAMGKLLLPPTQSITIFLRYIWTHFWINTFLSVSVGLFMFALVWALQKKNPRFFEEGELEMGALMAFIVGWPHFVIFFPLIFISVVLFGLMRAIFLKESLTTFGLPFLVAALIALVVAMPLLSFLHLTALVI